MTIHEAMASCGLSREKLFRTSGIPESTLRDILNSKTVLANCKAITISKLAKALHLPVESVLKLEPIGQKQATPDFEGVENFVFIRNNLLDILYGSSPSSFIRVAQTDKTAEWFFAHQRRAAALWLIGLMDYLCDRQGLPRMPQYDFYRRTAIRVWDGHVLCPSWLLDDDPQPMRHALPQFARFGIVETEETLKQF